MQNVKERCIEARGHRMNETVHLDLQLARQVTPLSGKRALTKLSSPRWDFSKLPSRLVLVKEGSAAPSAAAMISGELRENLKERCYLS
jgi:hypothetical protein